MDTPQQHSKMNTRALKEKNNNFKSSSQQIQMQPVKKSKEPHRKYDRQSIGNCVYTVIYMA